MLEENEALASEQQAEMQNMDVQMSDFSPESPPGAAPSLSQSSEESWDGYMDDSDDSEDITPSGEDPVDPDNSLNLWNNLSYLCQNGVYFSVNTPSGMEMKALLAPLRRASIVSHDWVSRANNESVACQPTKIWSIFPRFIKSESTCRLVLKSGSKQVETTAYVVPHIQDNVDAVLGYQFLLDNSPCSYSIGTWCRIRLNTMDNRPLFCIKGKPLNGGTFNLPLCLPELL